MRILLASFLIFSFPVWAQKSEQVRPVAKTAQTKKVKTNKVPTNDAKSNARSGRSASRSMDHLIVKAQKIEGNKKIEQAAIQARLVSKIGETFNSETIRQDIISIYRLGYFDDVQVEKSILDGGLTLTYRVVEKPSIGEIKYEGNSEIKEDDLVEASGLKAFEILNTAKIRQAIEKLQKTYEDKGYFLAKLDYRIEPIPQSDNVRLVISVVEGDKVKVKKIQFIGNKHLSDEYLKGRLFTQEEGYFSMMSGSGAFKQEAFERDTQVLRFLYYNKGYIKAKIDRPQVSVTPDKTGIYLTFRVEEGDQYEVGEVEFDGDLLFPRQELFESIKIDKNKVFAFDVMQKDMSELQAKYGDLGYAFTNVVPDWVFPPGPKKIVNIIFRIDKGSKVYFGRIDVTGNTKTRDKVVRRELKIREGELYNETRRRESQENVQRLGFFEEVNFKSSTPSEKLDVMNLDIAVKERNTGQIQVSAGYGTTTGFSFGGSVQQTNFLGKGQNLGVSLNITDRYSVYDVSFNEPYFQDTDWSTGFRLFKSSSNRTDYLENKTGASVSAGHPITEKTRFVLSYGFTETNLDKVFEEVDTNNDGVKERIQLTDDTLFPLDTASGKASTVTAALEYDSRNDRMRPSSGMFARVAAANTGALGGDLKYYKLSADYKFFVPVFWDVVFRSYIAWNQVASSDPSKEPPFNELNLLGGPYSLRGYSYGKIGKMRRSQALFDKYNSNPATADRAEFLSHRWFGGKQQLLYMSEFQFPMIREADMFGVVFFDMGQAEDSITNDNFYSDWGFGLRWFSPIGPLRFEWGFPLRQNTYYPEATRFDFSIGTPF